MSIEDGDTIRVNNAILQQQILEQELLTAQLKHESAQLERDYWVWRQHVEAKEAVR